VQHKTPVGLHRAAKAHRQVDHIFAMQRDFDLFKQRGQRHAQRAVDDDAHRAFRAVFADKGERAREDRVFQRGHRNQKMLGKIHVHSRDYCIGFCQLAAAFSASSRPEA